MEIVERNMSKADKRGTAILPGSKSTSRANASSGYAIQYHEPAIVGSHKLLTDIYDLLSMTWSDDRNLVDLHAQLSRPQPVEWLDPDPHTSLLG